MGRENLYIAACGSNSGMDFCGLESVRDVAADSLISHNFGVMAMGSKKGCKDMDRK